MGRPRKKIARRYTYDPAPRTDFEAAIAASGMTHEEIAKRCLIGVPYLRQILRKGAAIGSQKTFERIRHATGCRAEDYMHPKQLNTGITASGDANTDRGAAWQRALTISK